MALVIGNSSYSFANQLTNPSRDATAMQAVLERIGFEVIVGLDVDLKRTADIQDDFEQKIRGAEAALLFYAGHGLQVNGRNYLVPVDAQIETTTHLRYRAIAFENLLEPMADNAIASLVFLDACRDNPFARNIAVSKGEATRGVVRSGLAKVDNVPGTFIAFSTAPDQVAFDGAGQQNSPFTSALVTNIENPGVSISDLMIDVRNYVLEATGGRQQPWDQSSLRAPFFFVPAEVNAPTSTQAVQLSPPAEAWIAVQNSTSIAVLSSFKIHFAGTVYATFAEARMIELRALEEIKRPKIVETAEPLVPSEAANSDTPAEALPSSDGPAEALPKAARERPPERLKSFSNVGKIFVSYRRTDSPGTAGRIYDRLQRQIPKSRIFMDVDAIEPGMDFVAYLHDQIASCEIFLCIIGPQWLGARGEDGQRRLDSPNDFVRIEINAALRRQVPLIPVLVDGATMPRARDLPPDIRDLIRFQALSIRNETFAQDMQRLAGALTNFIGTDKSWFERWFTG
ncbi:MAG: caspase family protein [Xanthobacteraceae bacterium]